MRRIAAVALCASLVACSSPSRSEAPTGEVTRERLLNAKAEPDNWLTYSGSYNSHRYSGLTDITRDNVHSLKLKWNFPIQARDAVETTPLVVAGTMYLTRPPNDVLALDASTGTVLWTFSRPDPKLPRCCGGVNRGVAILGDTLYLGTLDAHLVALDAKTGREKWAVPVADYTLGFNITSAPLAVNDLIIIGTAGGALGDLWKSAAPDLKSLNLKSTLADNLPVIDKTLAKLDVDIRGRINAYDARTGKLRWQYHTIPGPGEPGHETWQTAFWKIGGAAPWMTGSYDPASNLLYWGIGNPVGSKLGAQTRPGDNLYSASVVALQADTGVMKWHYQFTPHDTHDWDGAQIPVLVDATFAGRPRELVLMANRNAFFYVLDRRSGAFLQAKPFARQNWSDGFEANGRPRVKPNTAPSPEGAVVSPAYSGGTNWWSPSYSPRTGLFYVTAQDSTETYRVPRVSIGALLDPASHKEEMAGLAQDNVHRDTIVSAVRALHPETGGVQWEFALPRGSTSGILTTASDVLFVGDAQGGFNALSAVNGDRLWQGHVGSGVHAAPVTYRVGGRQFVTIASAQGIYTFGLE